MNKPHNLTEEQVPIKHSDKCDLLIHLGLNNISYAIIDKNQGQLKFISDSIIHEVDEYISIIHRLDNLRESSIILQQNFNKVKISIETAAFTFIPDELFSKDLLKEYGRFISLEPGSEFNVSTISSCGIKNIFQFDFELIKELNARFKNPLIINSVDCFIESTSHIAGKNNSTQLFLNFQENAFEAVYYKSGRLIFYNKFDFATPDEFNYFLLNIIQQSDIDIRNTDIQVSGKIEQSGELRSRIEKYFAGINFAGISNMVKVSSTVESPFSEHKHFSLISLSLCE